MHFLQPRNGRRGFSDFYKGTFTDLHHKYIFYLYR